MCFCTNRQDAYTALARMPGCTALIPPQMDPKDRHNMFSMCTEAFLFPGSFTQAEISLRPHSFNLSKNDEQYKFDEHFSPWGLLDHCNTNYMDCPVWLRNSSVSAPSERIGVNKSIADLFKPIHYENNERWINSLRYYSNGKVNEQGGAAYKETQQPRATHLKRALSSKQEPTAERRSGPPRTT